MVNLAEHKLNGLSAHTYMGYGWVMGLGLLGNCMGYGIWGGYGLSPANQLRNQKISWGMRGYGLIGSWVRRGSTVISKLSNGVEILES